MYDRARAYCNAKFVGVETFSGYYGSMRDPKGILRLLPPDSSDEELGSALFDALSKSRIAKYEDAPDLYLSRDEMAALNAAWIQNLMQIYGYPTKRALFKQMKSCSIERRKAGLLTIAPTEQVGLGGWNGLPGEAVTLPADSSADAAGAALRLAFSRCIA